MENTFPTILLGFFIIIILLLIFYVYLWKNKDYKLILGNQSCKNVIRALKKHNLERVLKLYQKYPNSKYFTLILSIIWNSFTTVDISNEFLSKLHTIKLAIKTGLLTRGYENIPKLLDNSHKPLMLYHQGPKTDVVAHIENPETSTEALRRREAYSLCIFYMLQYEDIPENTKANKHVIDELFSDILIKMISNGADLHLEDLKDLLDNVPLDVNGPAWVVIENAVNMGIGDRKNCEQQIEDSLLNYSTFIPTEQIRMIKEFVY